MLIFETNLITGAVVGYVPGTDKWRNHKRTSPPPQPWKMLACQSFIKVLRGRTGTVEATGGAETPLQPTYSSGRIKPKLMSAPPEPVPFSASESSSRSLKFLAASVGGRGGNRRKQNELPIVAHSRCSPAGSMNTYER